MNDFQQIETVKYQAYSLNAFMESLGYKPGQTATGKLQYVTEDSTLKMHRTLSVTTAVRLHNMGPEGWVEFLPGWFRVKDFNLEIALNATKLAVAYAHRLVLEVKVQKDRKRAGGIAIQSQMVKLAQPYFANLIGV